VVISIFGISEIGFVLHNLLLLIDSYFARTDGASRLGLFKTDGQYELVKGR